MNSVKTITVDSTKLHPNPWNPNKMTDRQRQAIDESLKHYGQVLPLVVRPHPDKDGEYEIIDGEHRFRVTKGDIQVNVVEGLSDADYKRLTIVMNETRGEADKIELAQLLEELSQELGDDLITALPYDPTELDELVELASYDWDSFSEDFVPDDKEPDDAPNDADSDLIFKAILSREQFEVVKQAKEHLADELEGETDENAALITYLCSAFIEL